MSNITTKDINAQQLMQGGLPTISERQEINKKESDEKDSWKKSLEKANSYLKKMRELKKEEYRYRIGKDNVIKSKKKWNKKRAEKEYEFRKLAESKKEDEARKLEEKQILIDLQKKIIEEERKKDIEARKKECEDLKLINRKIAVDDMYDTRYAFINFYSTLFEDYLDNLEKIKNYESSIKEKYGYYANSFEEAAKSFKGRKKSEIKKDAQKFREKTNLVINNLSKAFKNYKECGDEFNKKREKISKLLNKYNKNIIEKNIINEIYELHKELEELLDKLNKKLINDFIKVKDEEIPLLNDLKEKVINKKWNIFFVQLNGIETYVIDNGMHDLCNQMKNMGYKLDIIDFSKSKK